MKQLAVSILALFLVVPSIAIAGSSDFESISVGKDAPAQCEAPRPPTSLARTAYVRNGYRAILRIMAAKRWRETDSCECFLNQITWDEVVLEAEDYITSDNPLVPFVVADLRIKADELLAMRNLDCVN